MQSTNVDVCMSPRETCVAGLCDCRCKRKSCRAPLRDRHKGRDRGRLAEWCSHRCYEYERPARLTERYRARGRECRHCETTDDHANFGSAATECSACAQSRKRYGLTPCCGAIYAAFDTAQNRSHYCPRCPGRDKAEIATVHASTGDERVSYHPRHLFENLRVALQLATAEELVIEIADRRRFVLGHIRGEERRPRAGHLGVARCSICRVAFAPERHPVCLTCKRSGWARAAIGEVSLVADPEKVMGSGRRLGSVQETIVAMLRSGPRPFGDFSCRYHRHALRTLEARGIVKIDRRKRGKSDGSS